MKLQPTNGDPCADGQRGKCGEGGNRRCHHGDAGRHSQGEIKQIYCSYLHAIRIRFINKCFYLHILNAIFYKLRGPFSSKAKFIMSVFNYVCIMRVT